MFYNSSLLLSLRGSWQSVFLRSQGARCQVEQSTWPEPRGCV